jgi:hypothetical protein
LWSGVACLDSQHGVHGGEVDVEGLAEPCCVVVVAALLVRPRLGMSYLIGRVRRPTHVSETGTYRLPQATG